MPFTPFFCNFRNRVAQQFCEVSNFYGGKVVFLWILIPWRFVAVDHSLGGILLIHFHGIGYLENGGGIFFRNIVNYLPDYTFLGRVVSRMSSSSEFTNTAARLHVCLVVTMAGANYPTGSRQIRMFSKFRLFMYSLILVCRRVLFQFSSRKHSLILQRVHENSDLVVRVLQISRESENCCCRTKAQLLVANLESDCSSTYVRVKMTDHTVFM